MELHNDDWEDHVTLVTQVQDRMLDEEMGDDILFFLEGDTTGDTTALCSIEVLWRVEQWEVVLLPADGRLEFLVSRHLIVVDSVVYHASMQSELSLTLEGLVTLWACFLEVSL